MVLAMFTHGSEQPSSHGRKPLGSASRPITMEPPKTGVSISTTTDVSTSPSALGGTVSVASLFSVAATVPSTAVVLSEELSSLPHNSGHESEHQRNGQRSE